VTGFPPPGRRKIVFISPAFQGGAALVFAAVVAAGWALFSWHLLGDLRRALTDASLTAHYRFRSAYDIVGPGVMRHLAALVAGTLLACAALFFLGVGRIRAGAERIVAAFRRSEEGDLSTPTDVPGPGEFAAIGKQIDAARAGVLEVIDAIRGEVTLLRRETLREDEFMNRWEGLKGRIGGLAP
jgi:methyl-accepting chemotaxis protein